MFIQPETLHPDHHRALRFSSNQPYDFARKAMLLPLAASELQQVAREIPIVLPKDGTVPQALVGLEPGRNLHVQDSGYWKGRYVPACIKAYPFRLIKLNQSDSSEDQQYAVQIDRNAHHFATPEGEALIDAEGKPAPLLKRAQQALLTLQRDSLRAEQQAALLQRHGLLVDQHILINHGTDHERALSGFRIVDTKALAALSSGALAELRDAGALAMAYAQILSLSNLKDGLLAHQAHADTQTPDIDELFGDDEDDISFDFDLDS